MSPEELQAINDQLDEDEIDLEFALLEQEEAAPATPARPAAPATPQRPATPAPKPAPQPARPKLGLGADGVFRMTDAQARDPVWARQNQAARAKATAVEFVPE